MISNRPSLSIIICTYNRKAALERICKQLFEQFKSLLIFAKNPQTLVADIELIVVDSNSTDGTSDLLFEILDKKKNNHLEINYIKETHQDFAITRNRAIKEAKGACLAFVSDELILSYNWLELVYQVATESDAIFFAATQINYDSNIDLPAIDYYPLPDPIGEKLSFPDVDCFLASREIFQSYGNFREDFSIYGEKRFIAESIEFFTRLISAGARFKTYPEIISSSLRKSQLNTHQAILRWYEDWGELLAYLQKNNLCHLQYLVDRSNFKLKLRLILYRLLKFSYEIIVDPLKSFEMETRIVYIKGLLI